TNLLLLVPTPLSTGQRVASTVLGERFDGQVNLTSNLNYAITWFSANTNIASVDVSGNVTGVSSGTTTITAVYAALGLTAAQAVQVTNSSATLVHRYSFSEVTGTNCADSVGGPAWD